MNHLIVFYFISDLCPPTYLYMAKPGSCYKLEYGDWDWYGARQHCNAILPGKSFLTVIDTQAKTDATYSYLTTLMCMMTIFKYNFKCFLNLTYNI